MQGYMLLSYEPSPNPRPKMLIQEFCHLGRTNVFPALHEAPSQSRYGIGMGLDQVGHYLGESTFIFQGRDASLLVGKQGGQRVHVVAIDAGDMWIRDDNERKVAKCLYAMS